MKLGLSGIACRTLTAKLTMPSTCNNGDAPGNIPHGEGIREGPYSHMTPCPGHVGIVTVVWTCWATGVHRSTSTSGDSMLTTSE